MRNSLIVTQANPRGNKRSGYAAVDLYPGMVVEVLPGGAEKGGRVPYRPFAPAAAGRKGLLGVVKDLGGLTGADYDSALPAGSPVEVYYPVRGDDLNLRVAVAGAGTTDAVAVGDYFITSTTAGTLAPIGASTEEPVAQCREALADVAAAPGTLVFCEWCG